MALSRDGSHIEDRDAHGQTALLWAARTGSVAMLNELLSHGANMDVSALCCCVCVCVCVCVCLCACLCVCVCVCVCVIGSIPPCLSSTHTHDCENNLQPALLFALSLCLCGENQNRAWLCVLKGCVRVRVVTASLCSVLSTPEDD